MSQTRLREIAVTAGKTSALIDRGIVVSYETMWRGLDAAVLAQRQFLQQ
ncbi:hypothetical protein [Mesorhizobium sp.]|nr:hypothetical protein [Mesorhizobium sp.]